MTQIKAIKHPQPEARPVLHIPLAQYDLWLVDCWSAPFVPLKPVCDALGLNLKGQIARLRRSKRLYNLKSVAATEDGKTLHLEAVPLENLSAFIFTLRTFAPHSMLMRSFEQDVARAMIFFWSRYQRDYVSPKTLAADLSALARRLRFQETPAAQRARIITPQLVAKIKEMKASGIPVSQIEV